MKILYIIFMCFILIFIGCNFPASQKTDDEKNNFAINNITKSLEVYGTTKWVSINSVIPINWIVIGRDGMNNDGNQFQIKYVGGAVFGKIEWTRIESPIPSKWVIIGIGMNGSNWKWQIEYIGEATLGSKVRIMIESPVPIPPNGWEIIEIESSGLRYVIKYTGKIVSYDTFLAIGNPPVFKWPVGAPVYWLLVSNNIKVASGKIYIDFGGLTSNVFSSTVFFSPGTYYWKVKYKDSNNTTTGYWSEVKSFTIK